MTRASAVDEQDVDLPKCLDFGLLRDVRQVTEVQHRQPIEVEQIRHVILPGFGIVHGDAGREDTADLVFAGTNQYVRIDFHGVNKQDVRLGWANGRRVPRAWFDRLRERIQRGQR